MKNGSMIFLRAMDLKAQVCCFLTRVVVIIIVLLLLVIKFYFDTCSTEVSLTL